MGCILGKVFILKKHYSTLINYLYHCFSYIYKYTLFSVVKIGKNNVNLI